MQHTLRIYLDMSWQLGGDGDAPLQLTTMAYIREFNSDKKMTRVCK